MMAVFQAEAKEWGFRVFPESGGFDLLLEVTEATVERVNDPRWLGSDLREYHPFSGFRGELEVGDVIAVEGKLRGTFEVLCQAMPKGRLTREWTTDKSRAADWYAVVIPAGPPGFEAVAEACGILVIECPLERPDRASLYRKAPPPLPAGVTRVSHVHGALRVTGYNRIQVPRLEVEMAAGQPAPRQITTWKIGAVELCLIAQHRPLTRKDFDTRRVSAASLVRNGWVECTGRGPTARWSLTGKGVERIEERNGRLVQTARRPDIEYPEIVAALTRSGFDPAASADPMADASSAPADAKRVNAEVGALFSTRHEGR
jgi:hypothetical protein